MMRTMTIVWLDGTEESITYYDYNIRNGVLEIIAAYTSRSYRFIPLTSIREYKVQR